MILSCLHYFLNLLWIWDTFYQEWKFSKMCNTNNALILWIKDFKTIFNFPQYRHLTWFGTPSSFCVGAKVKPNNFKKQLRIIPFQPLYCSPLPRKPLKWLKNLPCSLPLLRGTGTIKELLHSMSSSVLSRPRGSIILCGSYR